MPGRQLCKVKSLRDEGSCAEEKHAEITCLSNTKHTGPKPLCNSLQVKTISLTFLLIIQFFFSFQFSPAVFLSATNMSSYIKQFNLNLCLGPACIPHCSKTQCAATHRAGSFLSGGQLTSRLAVYVIFWPACCVTGSNSHLLNQNMLDRKECWIFFSADAHVSLWKSELHKSHKCNSFLHVREFEI